MTFKYRGFLAGMASSATFGMLPLFTLPIMAAGLSTNNILCYRMFLASGAMALLMWLKRIPFAISWRAFGWCMVLGCCYYASATLLFQGYESMSSGIATTLHFLYPVFVTLIMAFFFKQRTSRFTIAAIVLALTGITLLSLDSGDMQRATLTGIILVLLSGLAYALYIVFVNHVRVLRRRNNIKLAFYALLCSNVYFVLQALVTDGLHAVPNTRAWIYLACLALLPTLLSNLALMYAIKSIGSTLTSVLGAMEPLTAILIGLWVFDERFSLSIGIGIVLILVAVTLIILSPIFDQNIAARLKRFALEKADDDLVPPPDHSKKQ